MVAASFFGSTAFLIVTIALVALAAFGLGWLLFGTAARYKADKEMQARMAAIGRQVTTSGPQPVDKNAGGWIPENVVGFGRRFANSRGFAGRLDAELEAAGVSMRSGEFVVITVLALFVGGILGAALLRSPLLAIGIGLVAAIAPTAALRMALRKRAEKLRDQLPDVLTIMASSLRAGHSFLQSLDTVAKEIAQPAASEFQRVVAEIRLGRPADESLEAMAERVGSADFQWAVLAVNIQREVGGNLAEILDTVSDTLRERAQIRGQIRVLTSEGRLSAWVLGLMPVALGFYMFAVNPDYIGLLFTTTVGLVMLITSACLLVLGIFWMKKIVDIDV
jgi:tight adherence protein B